MSEILNVSNYSFSYDKKLVLDNISFGVSDSETTILIGANGAGKSTLIKCIAGIQKSKVGDITLLGKNYKEYKRQEFAKNVAYVPQNIMFESKFGCAKAIWRRKTEGCNSQSFGWKC